LENTKRLLPLQPETRGWGKPETVSEKEGKHKKQYQSDSGIENEKLDECKFIKTYSGFG
jgi:hypothetical protein